MLILFLTEASDLVEAVLRARDDVGSAHGGTSEEGGALGAELGFEGDFGHFGGVAFSIELLF